MNIAIVTGASGGLGSEYVRQLDVRGCFNEIWVIARRQKRLAALQKEVNTRLRILTCDLTGEKGIWQLSTVLKRIKPNVRVLVNSAGIGRIGGCLHIPREQCRQMIDLNCRAAVEVTQTVLPYMHRGAHILEICSSSAFQPLPYMSVYAASNAFLYSYSRALDRELAGTGIRVTAVCPFWIRGTEFIGAAKKSADSGQVNNFIFSSCKENVVLRSLADSSRGRLVSTPGFAPALHRILTRLMPESIMMRLWNMIRKR